MIRLHNQNRTHTFIDVESGQFISLPKDETDKPPVNADINGLQSFGKSTQDGEPTAENPVDPVDIPPEFNLTVCGRNLFDHRKPANFKSSYLVETVLPNGKQFSRVTGVTWLRARYVVGLVSDFIGKTITFAATASPAAGQRGRIDITYSSPNDADSVTGTVSAYGTVDTTQRLIVIKSNIQPIEGYPYLTVVFWVSEGNPSPDNATTTYTDIQLNVGTSDTYTPYTGNTYPYRLEDLDGTLHELCSLPDGTADTYNRETGEFVARTKTFTVSSSAGITYANHTDTLAQVRITDTANKWTENLTSQDNIRCNIGKRIITPFSIFQRAYDVYFNKSTSGTQIRILVPKSELSSLDDAGVQAWINAQIAAKGNIVFQYPLATPQIYKIKQYGETYDGVVWEYNEKPKSIQYHTNIFTDVGVEMQCEVRKLGNRAMGTFNWVTENGDKIITEDEDYIMFEY